MYFLASVCSQCLHGQLFRRAGQTRKNSPIPIACQGGKERPSPAQSIPKPSKNDPKSNPKFQNPPTNNPKSIQIFKKSILEAIGQKSIPKRSQMHQQITKNRWESLKKILDGILGLIFHRFFVIYYIHFEDVSQLNARQIHQ